jgi:hypothetical protein
MTRTMVNGEWLVLPDWRPPELLNPPKRRGKKHRGFVKARASVGLTIEQRRALELARTTSGLPMSEVIRRCLASGGITS